MARLELVAAIKEPKAPRARVSARTVPVPIPPRDEDRKDHFITRNGLTFAGSHLIIDLWEAEGLDDRDRIEQALIEQLENEIDLEAYNARKNEDTFSLDEILADLSKKKR